jgi:hypothetical protein
MKSASHMSDLGILTIYLGIKVHHDNSSITLRQLGCAKHILKLGGLSC